MALCARVAIGVDSQTLPDCFSLNEDQVLKGDPLTDALFEASNTDSGETFLCRRVFKARLSTDELVVLYEASFDLLFSYGCSKTACQHF